MEIRSVCVCEHVLGGFENAIATPWEERKTLPVLSVVQSITGSYRVRLGDGEACETGEMGVFVAPRRVVQGILHLPREGGRMDAHWAFLDVEINRMYKLDDLYEFPLVLPKKYNGEIYRLINGARYEKDFLKRLPFLHGIVDILFEVAKEVPHKSEEVMRLRTSMENHYTEQIGSEDLARVLGCSRSAMFQRFRELFGETPCRYINGIRIQRAQMLLVNTDKQIGEIASAVGISDVFYFSRLFKQMTGQTAVEYRKKAAGTADRS